MKKSRWGIRTEPDFRCIPMGDLSLVFGAAEEATGPCEMNEDTKNDYFTISCKGAPKLVFGSHRLASCKAVALKADYREIAPSNPGFDKGSASHIRNATAEFPILCGKIGQSLQRYRIHVGSYPTTAEGLDALVKTTGSKSWRGPYIEPDASFADPWGNAIIYGGLGSDYVMGSNGPDKTRGTSDDVICHLAK